METTACMHGRFCQDCGACGLIHHVFHVAFIREMYFFIQHRVGFTQSSPPDIISLDSYRLLPHTLQALLCCNACEPRKSSMQAALCFTALLSFTCLRMLWQSVSAVPAALLKQKASCDGATDRGCYLFERDLLRKERSSRDQPHRHLNTQGLQPVP